MEEGRALNPVLLTSKVQFKLNYFTGQSIVASLREDIPIGSSIGEEVLFMCSLVSLTVLPQRGYIQCSLERENENGII